MSLRTTWAGVVVASGLAAAAWGQTAPAGLPNVSGRWRLNEALSSALAGAEAPAPGKKDTPKGVEKAEPEKKPEGEKTPEGEKKPAELLITQSEVEVAVVETPGGSRSYYPNGKTYKADEGQSDVRSTWRDGKLVFEKRNQQGWRLTEAWQVSPDGKRLTIDQVFEGGHRPKTVIKRVYDRIEAQ
jgi:hypothetical protein